MPSQAASRMLTISRAVTKCSVSFLSAAPLTSCSRKLRKVAPITASCCVGSMVWQCSLMKSQSGRPAHMDLRLLPERETVAGSSGFGR